MEEFSTFELLPDEVISETYGFLPPEDYWNLTLDFLHNAEKLNYV